MQAHDSLCQALRKQYTAKQEHIDAFGNSSSRQRQVAEAPYTVAANAAKTHFENRVLDGTTDTGSRSKGSS